MASVDVRETNQSVFYVMASVGNPIKYEVPLGAVLGASSIMRRYALKVINR